MASYREFKENNFDFIENLKRERFIIICAFCEAIQSEMLRREKTYEQIIESTSRPIEDLDSRLTLEGFRQWYLSKYASTEQEQWGHETWQHG